MYYCIFFLSTAPYARLQGCKVARFAVMKMTLSRNENGGLK